MRLRAAETDLTDALWLLDQPAPIARTTALTLITRVRDALKEAADETLRITRAKRRRDPDYRPGRYPGDHGPRRKGRPAPAHKG